MLSKKLLLGVIMATAIGALAGCGGNDDSSSVPNTPPPVVDATKPSESVDNFIAYIMALVSSDTTEPVAIDSITAPTNDTTEPVAIGA